MSKYEKLSKDLQYKIYTERYEDVKKVLITYIDLHPEDTKELLDCLSQASKSARMQSTISSIDDEAKMLKEIFMYLYEKKLISKEDSKYVEEYVEKYRSL